MNDSEELRKVAERLAAPFDPKEIKWKPQSVKGNRALALCYIDARLVQERLDEVVGFGNWEDDYDPLPDGSVVCRLRVRVGGEWLRKVDVGSPSEQPDAGDRMKAAFSDALKRAAVKFGIGRYLYGVGNVWHDYDPVKRQFVGTPAIPAKAYPGPLDKPKDNMRAAVNAAAAKLGERATPAQVEELREYANGLTPEGQAVFDARLAKEKVKAIAELPAAVAAAWLKAIRGQKQTAPAGAV